VDEQKSMSRDEMVVGSYVCPVEGDGPRGVVARVELDERGPEYDLLHVSDADGSMRCQRAVMRLDDQPWLNCAHQYEDSPQELLKRIADLEAQNAEHEEARRSLRQEVQDFLRGMNEETERANKNAEELEGLRVDHAALYENYTEFKTAYQKAYDECSLLRSDNDHLSRVAQERWQELEALRAKIASMEAGEAAEIERLRKLLHEISEVATSNIKALRLAERDVAMHRRRAQSWQGAAADALSQLEDLRERRAGEEPSRG
jgi:chromosome segregation ATPase